IFSSRRRHTRFSRDWSSDVCSSDLNLHIEEQYKLVPKNGVYTVKSHINNKPVYGMMNIGVNPTVGGTEKSIEVHFFDFNEDLYRSEERRVGTEDKYSEDNRDQNRHQ